MKKLFLYSILLLIAVISCKENPAGVSGEYAKINSWIRTQMSLYYYWDEYIPEKADGNITPEEFYESIQEPNDIFSFISSDAQALLDDLNGNSVSAGYSPAFGRISGTDDVFIIVEFVYPSTPAEQEGIERGDIILGINGTRLDTLNYIDLFYTEGVNTLTMGQANYDEAQERYILSETGETKTVTVENLDLDPVLYTSVIDTNAHKIGYMFYSRFTPGENDIFLNSLNNTLLDFDSQGITELIIDLRYNPGGGVSVATEFANALVPPVHAKNEDIFVEYEYNEGFTNAIITQQGLDSPNLATRFSEGIVNLNLEKVYFLVTGSSASASELIVTGLEPYMDVFSIGTPTFGKFYGSFVLADFNVSNYAIVPVTFKYLNAVGVTDFVNGLEPDFIVEESLFEPHPIGDKNDPLFSTAIEHIVNGSVAAKPIPYSKKYMLLNDPIEIKKGSILIDSPLEF
jgi:carboxyl-terminal processing protease